MAEVLKVLAQSNPLAATLTDAYTVPGATQTVVSSIWVANRSATATSYRISVAINGAADNNVQYLAYDVQILGNESVMAVGGITIDAADVIRVYATLATLTFSIFGSELT